MAIAVMLHLVFSTLVAMVLGLAFGNINPLIASVSLMTGTSAGFWSWLKLKNERELFPAITFMPGLFYAFIIFAGLQHFLYLLYYDQYGLRTLHLNNFGDLSMHIQYIRHIAGGAHFWPDNPEYAGELLTYPLGMDLYNALWESLGVPVDSHLFVSGLVMTVVAVSVLHRWMGWWGVGAFFLNGGLVNWQCLWTGSLFDFQNAVAWKSFFLSLWITQRGFLYAIPAGAYVIKLISENLSGERELSRAEKIVVTVLWSGLAWFHLHTFFIVSLMLGICILLYKKVRSLLSVIIPVFCIGMVFVFFSTGGGSRISVLHITWGWVAEKGDSLWFWILNLGPWLLLGAVSIFMVFKKTFAVYRKMAAVFFGLFLVFTCVMVVPWDWDNIKVLLWLYLLVAWLIWRVWVSSLSPAAAFLIGCVVFFPGAISVVSSLPGNSNGVELYRAAELSESEAALMALPKDAVLAVSPDPNHPAMFWGVKVAMAYPGHVWSHGIDYSERENQLNDLFMGRDNWRSAARAMKVTHIYWGENEKNRYKSVEPPWRSELQDVSRSSKIQVYDLSK